MGFPHLRALTARFRNAANDKHLDTKNADCPTSSPSTSSQVEATRTNGSDDLEEYFLNDTDHQHFLTCTRLLAALDTVLPCEKNLSVDTEPAERLRSFQAILGHHCQVPIRKEDEVCAIMAAGTGAVSSSDGSGVFRIRDPRIIIAVQDDSESTPPRASAVPSWFQSTEPSISRAERKSGKEPKNTQLRHHITLTQLDKPSHVSPTEDALAKVYANLDRETSFDEHIQSYFRYLSAVHAADTLDSWGAANDQIWLYVFGACHWEMERRFAIGEKNSDGRTVNMWEILTTHLHPAKAAHAASIPIPHELAERTTNAAQREIIAAIFEREPDDGPHTFYATHTDRLLFQEMLRRHILRARSALQDIGTYVSYRSSRNAQGFRERVIHARGRLKQLQIFLNVFDDQLTSHIEWLVECANVVDPTVIPTWTSNASAVTRPAQRQAAPLATELEEGANDNRAGGLSTIHRRVQGESDPYKAYATSISTYMRHCCSHVANLARATPCRPGSKSASMHYEAAIITQAQIGVVHFEIRKSQKADILRIDEQFFTETLKNHNTGLRPDVLNEHLSDALQKSSTMNNAPHCQSLLMGLIALVNDSQIMERVTPEWLQQNGILATRAELFDMLYFPSGVVLHTLKKDCPTCETARDSMRTLKYTNGIFVNAQEHVKSRCAMLPTIMPKKLGDPILTSIKKETAEKLYRWQEQLTAEEGDAGAKQRRCSSTAGRKEPCKHSAVDFRSPKSSISVDAKESAVADAPEEPSSWLGRLNCIRARA